MLVSNYLYYIYNRPSTLVYIFLAKKIAVNHRLSKEATIPVVLRCVFLNNLLVRSAPLQLQANRKKKGSASRNKSSFLVVKQQFPFCVTRIV